MTYPAIFFTKSKLSKSGKERAGEGGVLEVWWPPAIYCFLLVAGLGSPGADLGADTRVGDSLGLMEGGHVWLTADR